MKPSLAYIGIGLMGLPMTRRLLSLGYAICVFDVSSKQCALAASLGANVAASAQEAVRDADIVVTNLPTGTAVEDVLFGTQAGTQALGGSEFGHSTLGIAVEMKPPQLLLDFSTVAVEQGKAFAERLKRISGCAWVDAPVSGGPPASEAGTLTIMAGGAANDIDRLRPLMADISARFTHMGPVGAGLATKMLNQLIVGCIHSVMAEAASLAEAAGIDAARLPEALGGGHADGTLLQRLYPRMVARDFAPQGYARQLTKDLEMVSAFAKTLGSPAPMLEESLELYRSLVAAGHSELDTSAVFKLYESRLIMR
jgi:3-hydroxyisobutyrate dehydrogenase